MKITTLLMAILLVITPTYLLAEEITITVKGMVCSFCAQGIKKAFGSNDTIEKVDVNLDDKRVSLSTKEGQTLDDKTITTIINDAGYDVVKIERN